MKEKTSLFKTCRSAGEYLLAVCKWLAAAGALGAFCGLVGAGFHKLIDLVTEVRMEIPWLVWLLPLAGVATLGLYRLCRVSAGTGTDLIFKSVATGEHVPILLAPLIVAATALSHLFGASVGREGAALQLGGSIGHNFGEALRLDKDDVKVLSMCGMAACFSALFGTPLTAAVFVLEVVCVGTLHYSALLPCAVSSYAAFLIAGRLGVVPLGFRLAEQFPPFSLEMALRAALLGVLVGLLGILFCAALHHAEHLTERFLKNSYVRIALGGLLMAVLTWAFDLYDYNGAGTSVIAAAMNGEAAPAAFLLKLLLTVLCVSVGYRGGEIVPTLFIGAAFGCVVGPLLGLPAGFAAALSMVALFCAAVNCPIASLFLAMELFGTSDLPLFVIAVAIAFVLSGYFSLYRSQRFVFSKVKEEELPH